MCFVWAVSCMPLLHSLCEQANTLCMAAQLLHSSQAELASNACYNTAPRSRATSSPHTVQSQLVLAPTPWCLCSQQTSARVESAAKAIGKQCGVEAGAVGLFAEEVVRPLNPAFVVLQAARLSAEACAWILCRA